MLAPLPPLAWASGWQGADVLATWSGFHVRDDEPSSGVVTVSVTSSDEAQRSSPRPEQVRAYAYLKEHQSAIATAVLADIFEAYPAEREQVLYDLDVAEDKEADVLPEISSPDELRSLISLRLVHVLEWARDELAYVGLVFRCAWSEDEWGILLHGDRIVGSGFGDTAFDHFVARGDGGAPLGPGDGSNLDVKALN